MIIQQLKFFILAGIQNWLYFTYFYVYYIPFFFRFILNLQWRI